MITGNGAPRGRRLTVLWPGGTVCVHRKVDGIQLLGQCQQERQSSVRSNSSQSSTLPFLPPSICLYLYVYVIPSLSHFSPLSPKKSLELLSTHLDIFLFTSPFILLLFNFRQLTGNLQTMMKTQETVEQIPTLKIFFFAFKLYSISLFFQ